MEIVKYQASLSELKEELGISVSPRAIYDTFSADSRVEYLRSVQGEVFSISANYLVSLSKKLIVKQKFENDGV